MICKFLSYEGSARICGFALYRASTDRYENALLPTGNAPPGDPEEFPDTGSRLVQWCTVSRAAAASTESSATGIDSADACRARAVDTGPTPLTCRAERARWNRSQPAT